MGGMDVRSFDHAHLEHLQADAVAQAAADRAERTVRRLAGQHRETPYGAWLSADGSEAPTVDEAAESLTAELASGEWAYARPSNLGMAWASEDEARTALATFESTAAAAETTRHQVRLDNHVYASAPWARFFLVTSSDGLVHASMGCVTCNKGRSMTTFALLPELSGTDAETAVAALGPALCSVCFPDAPVAWTDAERIPGRVATILFEKGPEEFKVALAEYRAKAAAKAKTACAGGGVTATDVQWRYRPFGKCATCGCRVSVTSTGRARAHKVAGA
jgi:hypothetical protein